MPRFLEAKKLAFVANEKGNRMNLTQEYINRLYGLTTRKGQRVKFEDQLGTVTGWFNHSIKVNFDGQMGSQLCHPTYHIEYLD